MVPTVSTNTVNTFVMCDVKKNNILSKINKLVIIKKLCRHITFVAFSQLWEFLLSFALRLARNVIHCKKPAHHLAKKYLESLVKGPHLRMVKKSFALDSVENSQSFGTKLKESNLNEGV